MLLRCGTPPNWRRGGGKGGRAANARTERLRTQSLGLTLYLVKPVLLIPNHFFGSFLHFLIWRRGETDRRQPLEPGARLYYRSATLRVKIATRLEPMD